MQWSQIVIHTKYEHLWSSCYVMAHNLLLYIFPHLHVFTWTTTLLTCLYNIWSIHLIDILYMYINQHGHMTRYWLQTLLPQSELCCQGYNIQAGCYGNIKTKIGKHMFTVKGSSKNTFLMISPRTYRRIVSMWVKHCPYHILISIWHFSDLSMTF